MTIVATVLVIVAIILFVMSVGNGIVKAGSEPEKLQNCVYSIAFATQAIFLLILAYILKAW
jgi:hypothetical protein